MANYCVICSGKESKAENICICAKCVRHLLNLSPEQVQTLIDKTESIHGKYMIEKFQKGLSKFSFKYKTTSEKREKNADIQKKKSRLNRFNKNKCTFRKRSME